MFRLNTISPARTYQISNTLKGVKTKIYWYGIWYILYVYRVYFIYTYLRALQNSPTYFFIIVRFMVRGFLNKYSWSHLIDLCFGLIAQAYDYLSRYLALHLPYLTGHTYVHSYLHLWVFVFNLNAQSIICITYRTSSTIDVFFFLLSGVYHQSQLIRQIVYGICKKIYIQFILQLNNIP